jgi:hypothetical protein
MLSNSKDKEISVPFLSVKHMRHELLVARDAAGVKQRHCQPELATQPVVSRLTHVQVRRRKRSNDSCADSAAGLHVQCSCWNFGQMPVGLLLLHFSLTSLPQNLCISIRLLLAIVPAAVIFGSSCYSCLPVALLLLLLLLLPPVQRATLSTRRCRQAASAL